MITPIEDLQTSSLRQSVMQRGEIKQIELENRSQRSKSSTRKLTQKPQQTIQVLSDQEQQQIISQKFQEQVFRAKIDEARLTKSKHTLLKVLYMELNFRNRKENEKENRFNSMVRMYISKNLKTTKGEPFDMRSSYFFQQMVVKQGECFVENQYLLYGCDLLPHKHIEKMFQHYAPSIKWINASHCRLTFMSKTHGWDAVINNCLQFEYLKRYILANEKVQKLMDKLQLEGEREMEQQHETKNTEEYFKLQKFKKEYHVLKEYIELMPYYELGFKRRIFMRNVTSSEQLIGYDLSGDSKSGNEVGEVKSKSQEKKKKESEYKRYLRVKDALWREIQNSPLVKSQYDKIQKQIHRQQKILKFAKRSPHTYQNKPNSRPYQNSNIREQTFSRKGNLNNISQTQPYNNQRCSHKSSYNLQQSSVRKRSRDQHFYQRHYPRGGHAYEERNINVQKKNKFNYRNDQLEKAFEEYIGQRDEVVVIQNPHRYLQPEFIDNRTGLHFYRNPFYNPPIQAQLSYPNYEHQDSPDQYQTPTPAYDYGSQSIPNPNLSGYEYDGNIGNPQNLNSVPEDEKSSDSRIINPSKKDLRQRVNSRHSMKSSKTSQSADEMFNNYCAQRDNKITEEKRPTHQNKKQINNYDGQLTQSQNKPHQHLFDPQEFSIITEQKTQNPKKNSLKVIGQNLQNILDQLHEDQTAVHLVQSNQISNEKNIEFNQKEHVNVENDDDSQDLEFMLRQRQDFNIKEETVKQEHQSRKINNTPQGFIEEKIKEEHIPKWFKSNPCVDDSQKLRNSLINSQKSPEILSNFEEIVCAYPKKTPIESSQAMKKKIHVKKARDSSISKSKRQSQSQSQTKKTKN